MSQHILTMVLYNRPEYTETVLKALEKCHGISRYSILIHVEPGNDHVIDQARNVSFAEVDVTINPIRFGIGLNTFRAWEHGFQLADFIIHLEDDTVPAPDFLRFMEFARAAGEADPSILSASAYNRSATFEGDPFLLARRPAYTCWGVGVWKSRWNWISRDWDPNPQRYATYLSRRAQSEGLSEFFPTLSRVQNIGAENGVHVPSPEWHRANHFTEAWAGAVNLGLGEFHF